jgi:hypothetical protein
VPQIDGLKFDVGFDDPRVPVSPLGSITREHGEVKLTCYGTDVPLTEVKGDEARKILGAATFQRRTPRWRPYAIGRDNDESYTYIDVGDEPANHGKWRVFQGKKGSLHEIAIVNTDHDDDWSNVTFGTKNGNLKAELVRKDEGSNFKLTWDGKKEMFMLSRAKEWKLIFNELKIYGARTPTPCDPMLQ